MNRNMDAFNPKILAICCNWCSYAGIDNAGISHHQYPPSIRIINVMCIGRVKPELILEAFSRGADGVLIVGCHVGDCHFINGNETAEKRLQRMSGLLDALGINSRRLRIDHIFAYEGKKFSEIVREFTEQVSELGPNVLQVVI